MAVSVNKKRRQSSSSAATQNLSRRKARIDLQHHDSGSDSDSDSGSDSDDHDRQDEDATAKQNTASQSKDDFFTEETPQKTTTENFVKKVDQDESADAHKIRMARAYLHKVESDLVNRTDDKEKDEDGTTSSSSAPSSSEDDESENDDEDQQEEEEEDADSEVDSEDERRQRRETLGQTLARQRQKSSGVLERTVAKKVGVHVEKMHQVIMQAYKQKHNTRQEKQKQKHEEEDLEDPRVQAKAWLHYPAHTPKPKAKTTPKANTLLDPIKYYRGHHDLSLTSVTLHSSGSTAYTTSKEGTVCMWNLERGQVTSSALIRTKRYLSHGRKDEPLCSACSEDGKYLAVGGRDETICIYDVRLMGKHAKSGGTKAASGLGEKALITSFRGHKGAVTGLAFRANSLQLFSSSEDRCVRHYNLEEMAHVETLYGHQLPVTSLSCYTNPRPISISRDRTLRAWKLDQASHLIYRGGSNVFAADCVTCVDEQRFVSGHEDGSLRVWHVEKKRPVETVEGGHVWHNGGGSVQPMVASCKALPFSDLVASGSNDGFLRFWKVDKNKQTFNRPKRRHRHQPHKNTPEEDDSSTQLLQQVARVPIHGYINDIAVGPKARFCALAVGQEHRLGRWDCMRGVKNRMALVQLRLDCLSLQDGGDESEGGEADEEEDEEEDEDEDNDSDGSSSSNEGGD